jgi:hypothetical protein
MPEGWGGSQRGKEGGALRISESLGNPGELSNRQKARICSESHNASGSEKSWLCSDLVADQFGVSPLVELFCVRDIRQEHRPEVMRALMQTKVKMRIDLRSEG